MLQIESEKKSLTLNVIDSPLIDKIYIDDIDKSENILVTLKDGSTTEIPFINSCATTTESINLSILRSKVGTAEIIAKDAFFTDESQHYVYQEPQTKQVVIGNPDEIDLDIILNESDSELFMQKAHDYFNECQHVSLETCMKALAKPYIECIG